MRAQLDVLREVFDEWLRIHVTWLNYGTGIDDELQDSVTTMNSATRGIWALPDR